MDLIELNKLWDAILAEARALVQKAKTETRDLSKEEGVKYDELITRAADVEANIRRVEKMKEAEEKRAAYLKEPANSHPAPVIQVTREQDCNDKGELKLWRSVGEQLMAVAEVEKRGGRQNRELVDKLERGEKHMRAASGTSETIASDGGFFVQFDLSGELLKRSYDTGKLGKLCRRIPISSESNALKINAIDETSRVDGSRWGGLQTYWLDEAGQYTPTKPKFRQIQFNLHKLTALFYMTEELMRDTSALDSIVTQGFIEEFGYRIDNAVLRGTGAGQPLGILNSNALVSIAKESGQGAATLVLNNLIKMRARQWLGGRGNSQWIYNQDIEPQLLGLNISVGNNAFPVYLPGMNVAGNMYDTLFARPSQPVEQASTLGTVGDILLCDFSQYVIVDKGSLTQSSSVHVRFLFDEQVFKFMYRIDGMPWWAAPLTPAQGTNTQSPFITLATR